METLRWIISLFVAIPAGLFAVMKFGLACRNLLYFTSRGPSPFPVIGSVFAIIGLLVVPKTESFASLPAVTTFAIFVIFEVSHPVATAFNGLRAKITGRHPS